MKVGISGTRQGATQEQKEVLAKLLSAPNISQLIHGGAEGVDEQADEIYHKVCAATKPRVIVYPATFGHGTYSEPHFKDVEREPLKRNRLIVAESDIMIIVPSGYQELVRSGTWATYRYASHANLITIVIYPNGDAKVGK
jgi:predicted Rossmann fold nucleotide-binding protein DprA/Smf involved in DNA uptake